MMRNIRLGAFAQRCLRPLRGNSRQIFVNGESMEAEASRTLPVVSPRDGQIFCTIGNASAADVDKAVRAARECYNDKSWSSPQNAPTRASILRKLAAMIRADTGLATLETKDCGKPLRESQADMDACAGYLDYFAQLAEEQMGTPERLDTGTDEPFAAHVEKEPVGVVACVTPWNYPLMQAVLKVAPALAAGCTVVLKPAPSASLTCLALAKMGSEAGLPPGALNVLTGGPPEALEGENTTTGQALIDHPDVDKLSFTGSGPAGQAMLAASAPHLRPTSLELGGKSAAIVFDDAREINTALVDWLQLGIFCTTGQICSATSRVLVEETFYEELLADLKKSAASIRVGDPLGPATQMGPLASEAQYQRVQRAIQLAQDQGVQVTSPPLPYELTAGGDSELAQGYYVAPTILSGPNVTRSAAWKEEIFGPVLCVAPFSSEEQAVELANLSEYGLAAAVFSTDSKRCARVASALEAGVVWQNCSQVLFNTTPFGGRIGKKSGFGHENGQAGFDEYVSTKTVVAALNGYNWDWYGST